MFRPTPPNWKEALSQFYMSWLLRMFVVGLLIFLLNIVFTSQIDSSIWFMLGFSALVLGGLDHYVELVWEPRNLERFVRADLWHVLDDVSIDQENHVIRAMYLGEQFLIFPISRGPVVGMELGIQYNLPQKEDFPLPRVKRPYRWQLWEGELYYTWRIWRLPGQAFLPNSEQLKRHMDTLYTRKKGNVD